MKVAIDITPLKTGHQFRGIGFYTKNLTEALKNLNKPDFSVELIEKGKIPDDCDLVHYPFFDFFFLTLPLQKIKPTVVTIHDCTPLVFPEHYPPGIKGKVKFLVQKFSLRGVERIMADSENSKNDIVKFLGYPREKIDVVCLAAANKVKKISDELLLEKVAKKFKLPQKFVLYVGDVNHNKNLPGLVKACQQVEVKLVLVGKQMVQKDFNQSHPENKSLLELNKLVEGNNDVLRLGFIEENDLSALYNLASVYCQPSFYEGFGLQILEAMTCGCPVVTSNVSSLPEVAGEAALLINPNNIGEISGAIRKVLNDEKLRKKMIEFGFENVKKFSWEKTAKQTIASYTRGVKLVNL